MQSNDDVTATSGFEIDDPPEPAEGGPEPYPTPASGNQDDESDEVA